MQPIILYIGGSYPQRLAVRELVKAGFEVHVTDREANPSCAAETPHVHRLDATDVDKILALAKSLRKKSRLIGVYGIADYAFGSVAAVNRLIGGNSASPSALLKMIDKISTKEALRSRAVPMALTLWSGPVSSFHPSAIQVTASAYVLVKPASLHASEGVKQVAFDDGQSLHSAVIAAGRRGGDVLIEEFLPGAICNFDGLAIEGEVIPISMTYRIADEKLAFTAAAQIQPKWDEVPNAAELLAIGQASCEALGYTNGPFTIDYISTPHGPRVLEVSPHFHSIALEIFRGNGNPLRAWLRYLAGDSTWRDDLERKAEQAGAVFTLRAHETGVLSGVTSEMQLKNACNCSDYVRYKEDGSKIESLSASGVLVSLGWFVGGSAWKLEAFIRDQINDVRLLVIDDAATTFDHRLGNAAV